MSIKLVLCAKDFNVSIKTIVEILAQQNIKIDKKPTTLLSEGHYNLLKKHFEKD